MIGGYVRLMGEHFAIEVRMRAAVCVNRIVALERTELFSSARLWHARLASAPHAEGG